MAGGLGNQLFQFAYIVYIAKKFNIDHVVLDEDALGNYKAQHSNHLTKVFDFKKFPLGIKIKRNLLSNMRIPRLLPLKLSWWPFIGDHNSKSLKTVWKDIWIDGYFIWDLSTEDFYPVVDFLRENQKENHEIQLGKFDCVVHIRGGDFVELGWNKLTPDTYYLEAMKRMSSEFGVEKFIVITDDVTYATSLLCQCDVDYEISSNDMMTDFHTIAQSKYKIIGGSSFAIWATLLGYNESDGVVIAPSFPVKLPNQV